MEDILTYLNIISALPDFHSCAVITVFIPIRSTSKILALTNTEKASADTEGIPKNEKTRIVPPSITPRPAGDSGTNIRMDMSG